MNATAKTKKALKGIDVSSWQGVIDWNKVKQSGVDFAIIRCAAGINADKRFRENADGCAKAGIPFGVYIYSYALNENDAQGEAEKVYSLIKDLDVTCGVWFDMEDGDGYKARNGFAFTKRNVTSVCRAFLERAKELGLTEGKTVSGDSLEVKNGCGIYASLSWFGRYIDENELGCPVWVAQWADKLTYAGEAAMWQYTSKGRIDGISGNVDLNEGYFDISESEENTDSGTVDNGTSEVKSVWDYTANDLVWELAHRGIITDKGLWLRKFGEDADVFSLAQKTVAYLAEKGI